MRDRLDSGTCTRRETKAYHGTHLCFGTFHAPTHPHSYWEDSENLHPNPPGCSISGGAMTAVGTRNSRSTSGLRILQSRPTCNELQPTDQLKRIASIPQVKRRSQGGTGLWVKRLPFWGWLPLIFGVMRVLNWVREWLSPYGNHF